MRRLLFVHGVAQGGRDPADIRSEWVAALERGCAAAGIAWNPSLKIDLPFYGDRLDSAITRAAAPSDGDAQPARADRFERFASKMLVELHQNHPAVQDALAKTELDVAHETEGLALNSRALRAISEAIDRRAGAEGFLVSRLLKEVHFYVDVPAAQREVDQVIDAAITDEETVIVAHSLGTVVAYRAMLRNSDAPFVHQVTVGSPLACSSIRTSLGTPHNPIPGAWFNARDPHDFVAFYPLDDEHFATTPPITNYNEVRNTTPNRHGISGYLSDPDVATSIMAAVAG